MTNTSGIYPLDLRVLVKPDAAEEKIGSIIMPDTVREKNKYAVVKATLIEAGVNAWAEARRSGFVPPEPGARVMISKYGGVRDITGADGEIYAMLNDEDVVAILTEEAHG